MPKVKTSPHYGNFSIEVTADPYIEVGKEARIGVGICVNVYDSEGLFVVNEHLTTGDVFKIIEEYERCSSQ